MRKRSKILAVALSLSMSICVGVQSVQAIDIDGYDAFTDLQKAIVSGTDPIINITGNIDRRLMDSDELGQINPELKRLDIYGNKNSLKGLLTGSDDPIIVSSMQELNILDLEQNEFTQFITNNGGVVNITSSNPGEFRSSYYDNDGVVFTNNNDGIFKVSYTDIHNNSNQAIVNNSGQVNLENVIINKNMQGLLNKGTAYIGASSFENNSNNSSQGAAIDNSGTVYIKDSNFTGNSTSHNGGAITNAGGLFYAENTDFDGNSATANGGAVDTWGATGVATFIDSSFRNNHTNEELKSDEGYIYSGGAITNNDNGTLNIAAINKDVEFTDNYIGKDNRFGIIGSDNRQSNAIANMGTVYLNASEGRRVVFNDAIGNSKNQNGVININSADATLVNGSGDSVITPTAGTIEFNNTVSNQTINMYGGIVKLGASNGKEDFNKGKLGSFDVTAENHVSLNYYVGVLDLINGSSDSTNIGWLSLYEDMDVAIDAIGSHADYLNTSETVGNSNFDTNGHTVYFSKINLGDATKFEGLAGSLNSADWENFGVKANTELVGSGNISNLNTLVSYNNNTGILKVGDYSLQDAVAETEGTRYYRLQQTENVGENLGEMLNTGILTIVGNSQAINGGGFSGILVGEGDELVINNVSSFGGFNSTTGAVINAISGVVNITNTNLENNSAVNGGAIAMSGNSNVTLTDSRISGNTAVNGGGIYTDGAGINLTLNNSNIEANRAEEGAAIYNNGGTGLVLNNTSITENIGNSSIYNNGELTINSNNGGVLVIDNKLSEDDENGVIKNIGSLELNAFDKSEINISDKILGLSNKRDDNIISINNNSQEGIVSILGGIENSVLTVKAGTANIVDVINSMINADGVGTSISGNITNSNITASADNTSISGTVNGSMIATSSKTTLITADVSNGSTITSNSGTTTITGTVGNSTITSSSGQMAVESSVKNSTITTTGGTTTLSGEISDNSKILNNGTGMTEISGTVSGSSVSTTKGKTTITESGIIKDGSTVTTNGSGKTEIRGEVTGSSTINNSGGETTISNSVSNSTVNVSGGSVEVTSTGIINGTQVNVTNGNANIGGSVTTGSTVSTTYGTTNISGTVSGSEIITIAQGQTTISGNVSNNSSIFNSGLGTTTITGVVRDSEIEMLGGTVNVNNSIIDSAIEVTNSTLNIGISGKEIDFTGTTVSIGKAYPGGKGDEDGTANLLASAINSGEINLNTENSVLNTSQNSKIASSIKGNGVINKTGNTVLRFSSLNNSNGADYTGDLKISEGQVILDSGYRLNADANIIIENANLDYTVGSSTIKDNTIANIILKDGAEAKIIGSSSDAQITLADKFWDMQGTGKLTLKDANYILAGGSNPFSTGSDIINFEKAHILFTHTDNPNHNYGNIALNDFSVIELADGHGGDSHNFENIISNGENYFNTDIDLHLDNVSSNPISDKLVVNNGSGKLTLTELYITDDNGLMGQIAGGKVIQLIENKNPEKVLQLEDVKDIDILSWATNIYKYGVTSESSGFKDSTGKEVIDSIRVENNGPSSTDTLRDLNIYQGKDGNNNNRGFSFLVDADGKSTYNIYRDLNKTNKGVFTILGKANSTGDENFEKSVLSGTLKDLQVEVASGRLEYDNVNNQYIYKSADGTAIEAYINPNDVKLSEDKEYYIIAVGTIGDKSDTQGSMFELTDNSGQTSFKIENIIIENAKRYERDTIKDGSVIYANSSQANIVLSNTDFRSNSVDAGNGGAIANISSEKFSITNGIFIENTAKSGLGGAIYNAEKAEMSIVAENSGLVQFAGNSAEKGGAIYNAGVLTMSATNSDSKIVVEAGTSDATNDIYNTGTLNLLGNIEINSGINDDNSNPSGITNVSGTLKLGDTAQIIQKGLQIATGGVISTNANNLTIKNGITNDGTLEFKGNGTNNNTIKHSSGNTTSDLIISGNVENIAGVSIAQNDLTITGSLIANASDLAINNGITNDGTLEFKGNGINKNTIKNSSGNTTSNLVISGNVENIDGVSIAQNDLTITGSLIANASDLVINNGITNNGALEFKGSGTNNNDIKGIGSITIDGSVINESLIQQEALKINDNGGSLTTSANNIITTSNKITNNGTLVLNSGVNDNIVEGIGTTVFDGTEDIINNALILQNVLTNGKVQNNGKISGNLNVGSGITDNSGVIVGNVVISGGELISLAENLATGAGSNITNNSSLIISGILDKEILGQGTTTIRNDAGGKTLTLVEGGGVKGTLNLNDGILNMIDDNSAANKINEHEIGKLAGNGEIRIDVDMSPLNPDSSANSDKLIINDAENNTVVNLNTINITADHAYPDDPDLYVEKVIQVIDTQSKDNVIFNVGTDGKTSTMTSDYLYTFEKTENHGELRVQLDKTTAGLADFIQGISGAETVYNYSMTRDESSMDIPPEAIGITHRDNIPTGGLNVYMNGHNLSGNNNEGITVAEDYILNVIGSGGTISNFETAFKVNEGGELNLSNITFKDNDLALNNAGELNLSNINFSGNSTAIENFGELNLSSTNTISGGIIGDGTINIISGLTEFSGAVEQGKISVSQNSGLIGSADDIKIVQGIENNGNIIFTGGKNTNTITGNGLIDFADGMENSGVITQGAVILSNTFTNKGSMEITNTLDNGGIITNDGLIVLSGDNISNNGTISNNNKLVLSGEYIKNSGLIDGTGTTEIAGKVQNTGTIAQDIEINESGELTSQAGNIKKDIHNDGTYNVLGGMIQNTISGTGNLNLSNNTVIGSEITGNKINLNNGILSFVQDADISGASLVANGGSINFQNNAIENTNLGNLILNSDLNITIDGSFAEHELDTISANGFTNNGSYHINISNILLSTPTKDLSFSISPIGSDMDVTVQNALAGAIQYTGGEIIYSPIYKYSAKYDPDTALMNFNRIGGGGYNSYNPGVFAGAVASQLGGYLTQLNSYDEAFRNMDMYMLMTKEQRQAMKLRNKYSSTSSNIVYDPTINQYENKAGWFRPYATFEKVDLKGGPTVSNVSYGSFFGAESEMMDLGHGWDGIWGVYGGYNGSHQAYDGIGIYQNGGTLGVIGMAYKGNFFTGLTVNAGANSGEASTMYGQDNFTMLMSGVASKSGYNWELAKGKFIIQPNFLMSYSYVNTFNYKDAQGVSISSDPLHAIQIEPGIKLIGNLKNGWQPYMSVSMVWNIMDKTEFQANNVALPELSIKPFVKYGVGVRKSWGERFTGFFQTYFTNGGRNGVGLQLGLRWMLGKNPAKKSLNGPVPELKKTEIKVGRR